MSEAEVYVDGRPLSELKVVDLKKELDKRNLSKSGVKNVLQDRLRQYILEQESSENINGGAQKLEPVKEAPTSSNPLIAEYLARQQQALQEQQKVAAEARAAASPGIGELHPEPVARNGPPKRPAEEPVAEPVVHHVEPKADVVKEQKHQEHSPGEGLPRYARDAVKRREEPAVVQVQVQEEESGKGAAVGGDEQDDERRSESPARKAESENESSKEQSEERSESPQNDDEPDELATLREAARKSVDHKKRESPKKGDSEPKAERKRKWGSTRSAKRPAVVAISTDSLKDMMKEAEEVEQKIELDYDDEHIEHKPKRIVVAENDGSEETAANDDDVEPSAKRVVVERGVSSEQDVAEADGDAGMNGDSAELTTEDGLRRRRAPSPARYPVDCVLHIRCLTRPFTNKALRELLGKYGNVSTDEFWIDTIKTNCLVKFDTPEEAELARSRLHNVIWPLSNPKCLRVDFASQEVMDRHLKGEKKDEAPKAVERENNRASRDERRHRSPSGERPDAESRRRSRSSREKDGVGREWDKGKQFKVGQSPPRDDRRRRSSRSPARRPREAERVPEAKPPAKLLDDLFNKTKAVPSIYWLPLTDEQAAQRTKHKAEEKAKQAEVATNRDRDRDRRGERGDRRSPPRRRRSPSPSARRR